MAELVAAGGRRAATVRKLTKLAGVSTATFYSQFDGTEDCLVGTYVALMDRVCERVAATRLASVDRRKQAYLALRALLDALFEDPKAGRLLLIEIFDAGPAALGPIKAQETRLEATLRESLDRRGQPISAAAVAWAVAGTLHCARQVLGSASPQVAPDITRGLLRWGQALLVEAGTVPSGRDTASTAAPPRSIKPARKGGPLQEDETDLILNAVLKVACADGYWRLSVSGASRAAGIPATHFKRYFRSLDEAYLFAVERSARSLFSTFGSRTPDLERPWTRVLQEEVASLSVSLATAPRAAGVVFGGVLAPGAEGLTRREDLIDELAETWRLTIPAAERPEAFVAEASMASLWSAFARVVESERADALPGLARTNAQFFLGPMASPAVDESPGPRQPVSVAA